MKELMVTAVTIAGILVGVYCYDDLMGEGGGKPAKIKYVPKADK